MPINCVIFYDNPAKVFYSGQLLGGRVELSLTDSQKVRGKHNYLVLNLELRNSIVEYIFFE